MKLSNNAIELATRIFNKGGRVEEAKFPHNTYVLRELIDKGIARKEPEDCLPFDPAEIVLAETWTPSEDLAKPDPTESVPEHVPTPRPAHTSKRQGRGKKGEYSIPRPKVPTGKPDNQNKHALAISHDDNLSGNAKAVGLTLHVRMGNDLRRQFGEKAHAYSNGYLATASALSESTVRRAIAELVEAGYYVRVDKGDGGSRKGSAARYLATLPELKP